MRPRPTPRGQSQRDADGYASKDASALLPRMPVQRRQGCQLGNIEVSQGREWADASPTRARTPAQGERHQRDVGGGASGGQRRRRDKCDDASITAVTTPTRGLQGCQHSAGLEASSAMTTITSGITSGQKPARLGRRYHCDGAMAPERGGQRRQRVMRASMPARQGR